MAPAADKKPEQAALAAPAAPAAPAAAPAPAAPAPAPKKKEWQRWGEFYSAHSPVMYTEMVERWGSEQALWDAYASGKMERAECDYFEGPRIFSAARAFANVVIPKLRAFEQQAATADARIAALEAALGVTAESAKAAE